MDWSQTLEIISNNLPLVVSALFNLILNAISLILVLVKTRTRSLQKKVLNLSDYYVEIDGKIYYLNDLKIQKKWKYFFNFVLLFDII